LEFKIASGILLAIDIVESFVVVVVVICGGRVLYFDTCCLCHSCNSRVINFLFYKI